MIDEPIQEGDEGGGHKGDADADGGVDARQNADGQPPSTFPTSPTTTTTTAPSVQQPTTGHLDTSNDSQISGSLPAVTPISRLSPLSASSPIAVSAGAASKPVLSEVVEVGDDGYSPRVSYFATVRESPPAAEGAGAPTTRVLRDSNSGGMATGGNAGSGGNDGNGGGSDVSGDDEPTLSSFGRSNSVTVAGVVYGAGPGTGLEGLSRSFSKSFGSSRTSGSINANGDNNAKDEDGMAIPADWNESVEALQPFAVVDYRAAGTGVPKMQPGKGAAALLYVDGGIAQHTPPPSVAAAPVETPYGFASPSTPAPMVSKRLPPAPLLQLGSPRKSDDQYTSDAV